MNNNFSLYCPGNRNNVRYIDGYRQSHSCRRSGPRLPPRRSNDHRCSHSHRVAANRNSRGVKTADVSSAEGIEAIVSAVTHIVGRQPWQTSSSYRPFRRPLDPRAKCSEPTDFRRSLTSSRRRACWVVATDRAVSEGCECPTVGRDCVVVEEAIHDLLQPCSLLGDGLMHAPPQFFFDLLEFGLHAVPPRFPPKEEVASPGFSAYEGET